MTVLNVGDGGLDVQAGDDGATGFVKRADLGRDRDEQRPDRFQVGQKFDAMVVGFDRSKKPNFSIKALQVSEEKQAVKQYGSTDSGASLGDILGEALKQKSDGKDAAEAREKAPAKPAKKAKADKPTADDDADKGDEPAAEEKATKPKKKPAAKPKKKADSDADDKAEGGEDDKA